MRFPRPRGGAGRWPARKDVALALAVSIVALFAPVTGGAATDLPASIGGSAESTWSGLLSVALALGQGVPLAWRTRRPSQAAAIVLVAYAGTGIVSGLTPPLGPWVMIWSTWSLPTRDAARPRVALIITTTTCLLIALAEAAHTGSGASALLVAVTVLVAFSAELARADHSRVEAVRDRAATAERLRIARDLHDVVGHGLSVVAIQSGTARLALDAGDAVAARAAIGVVETASRTAMREMRQMLGLLTEGGSDPGAQALPGIEDIADLVKETADGGTEVSWERSGDLEAIGPGVQLCAYRVVQEAVTNAVKHAPGQPISIRLVGRPDRIEIAVDSTGPVRPASDAGGMGLTGLRARVDAAGGRFSAGPSPDGWLVKASLPVGAGGEQ